MSARNLFLALLVANLLFAAWALWLDPVPGAAGAVAAPAQLQLAGKAPATARPSGNPPHCYSIGPYADEEAMNRVKGVWNARGVAAAVRRIEAGEPAHAEYWLDVSLPAADSAPQAGDADLANGGTLQITPCAAAG